MHSSPLVSVGVTREHGEGAGGREQTLKGNKPLKKSSHSMLGLCMNSKQLDLKEMRVYFPKNFSEVQKCLFYSVGSVHDENFR